MHSNAREAASTVPVRLGWLHASIMLGWLHANKKYSSGLQIVVWVVKVDPVQFRDFPIVHARSKAYARGRQPEGKCRGETVLSRKPVVLLCTPAVSSDTSPSQ